MRHSPLPASTSFARVVLALALALASGAKASAQCAAQWLPGLPLAGADQDVYASIEWDPDGAGPAGPRLVIGGQFYSVGTIEAPNSIAAFDLQTGQWSKLGDGLKPQIYDFAVLPNNELVACGSFSLTSGGAQLRGIARWDSTAWRTVGNVPGTNQSVYVVEVVPNGDLIAGGNFTSMAGVQASRIARWDGVAWSSLGSGLSGNVFDVLALPNGDLLACGDFTSTGAGVSAQRVARWSGGVWSPLGTGMNGAVGDLALLPNGDVLALGAFSVAGGVNATRLARWDGAAWSPYAPGLGNAGAGDMVLLPSGELLVSGVFDFVGSVSARNIARWNGVSWLPLGHPDAVGLGWQSQVTTMTRLSNGQVFVGGRFSASPQVSSRALAMWDGANWSGFGGGFDNVVRCAHVMANGDLVVGGDFSATNGTVVRGIARRTGSTWAPLGEGFTGTSIPAVQELVSLPNGDLVAAGNFAATGNLPVNNIARWNGSAWFPLGAGVGVPDVGVYALAVLPNGDLVAGGSFATAGGVPASRIARWDGATWHPLGSGIVNTAFSADVGALAVLPNGDLVAAGSFTSAGGVAANGIARWDGNAWWSLGSGVSGVRALLALPNGELIAGGSFSTAGGVAVSNIARWDGNAWWPMGSGMNSYVHSLLRRPNGDVLAGGWFTQAGGVTANYLALWDGSAWRAELPGIGNGVFGMTELPNGDLAVCGYFTHAGGAPSAYFAQAAIPCSSYCSAGVTSNNCTAAISGVGAASASANSGYTLSATNVEGAKQGLILYGISGRIATPWAPTSSSLLCVKSPTQRTSVQNSGGASGTCQGVLSLDWNAYRASNPGALGNPFSAGQRVQAQAWFRDPPAPRGTNLSNALEFTVGN